MVKFKKNILLLIMFSLIIFKFIDFQAIIGFADSNMDVEVNSVQANSNFSDDSVIIVLDEDYSDYISVSNILSEKIYKLGAKAINDLTAFPKDFINSTNIKTQNLLEYYEHVGFNQILCVELKNAGKQNVLKAIREFEKLDGVKCAYPNYIDTTEVEVDVNTRYSEQWGLGEEDGIDATNAWGITTGNQEVRIGIIDTGIATHEDLNDNVVAGYDFFNDSNITNDDLGGHGTHVAGIIGATGKEVSGVAPNISLVPLQAASDTSDSGYYPTAASRIAAITYAKNSWLNDKPILALNHSIGGFGIDLALLDAIENYPGLFVWSAGNAGSNVDDFDDIDKFNLPNIISVGAINQSGERSVGENWASNYGNAVDVFAPGSNILSTVPNNVNDDGYEAWGGTSMAAPHVAGVAALMLSINPSLTGAQLKDAIMDSADTITIATPDGNQTVKKLNAYNAVKAVDIFDVKEMSLTTVEIEDTIGTLEGNIIIPSKYNGKTVVSIGVNAFYEQEAISSITIPDTVTSIGASAFEKCTGLDKVVIPNSVTNIGFGAFLNCDYLAEITLPYLGNTLNGTTNTYLGYIFGASRYENQNQYLPESLTKVTILGGDIYSNAFYGCNKLTQISISTNVESIGIYAFNDCTSLQSVTFTSGSQLTSIGQNAFKGCISLTSITIPATVTSIGSYAFKNCTSLQIVNFASSSQLSTIGDEAFNGCGNLTSISIPATVTSIGGLAFSDCTNLQSVTFANGSQLTSIGYNAFSDCSSLTSITIPATVTNIGSYVFNDCTSLQSVNFAENSQLTFISYNAFSDCSSLTNITLPASIKSIGMQAFNTCTSLQSINFAENSQLTSIDYQAFINCSSLESIQIPAGVTVIHPGVLSGCTSLQSVTFAAGTQLSSIANNAFTGCTSLTNIALPATVTNIGNQAFYGCTILEKVVIYNQSTVPTLGTDCFTSAASTLQIYVPNSLLNSYKTATNWSGYASKTEGYYLENGQPYILQTYTVSAAELLDCISLYSVDSNYDIESEGGVFLEYTAVIGYGMGHYFFAECLLDYDLGEVVDCSLKIEVYAGGTGCYLLDSDKYVIAWCSVEDYILTVPFMEIYNYCEGEFYLFPEEDCEENIEFTAQDVSLEYVVKVNI